MCCFVLAVLLASVLPAVPVHMNADVCEKAVLTEEAVEGMETACARPPWAPGPPPWAQPGIPEPEAAALLAAGCAALFYRRDICIARK
jgi:hypothetical protein